MMVAAAFVAFQGAPAHAAIWCGAETGSGGTSYVSRVITSTANPQDAAAMFADYLRVRYPFSILSSSELEPACSENIAPKRAEESRQDWIVSRQKRRIKVIEAKWFATQ